MLLISSLAWISACASVKTGDTTASRPEEPPRVLAEEPEPASGAKGPLSERQVSVEAAKSPKPPRTRISPKERYVNIRSAPSTDSKTIAVFKGGHSLDILQIKDNWVKIQWNKGGMVKQGWLKKRFAEGYQ
ncbi:MAG: SH3 domain-containing protein [Phycisphaerae bacterium]|nr:SH3 domain-containing protein [Saprospiraceae bacterium]